MSSEPAGSGAGRGRLIVISGPSGAGKTSICEALLRDLPGTVWSVSVTTRPPRPGETAGEWYEFISPDEFARREKAGELLESAEYIGHRYGTPRRPVEAAMAAGRNVVMEIDVQGTMQVAGKMPDSIRIFVLPPDAATLQSRLQRRNTEADDQLQRRLDKAREEMAAARECGCYQYFVTNNDLQETIREVESIILKESVTT